MAENMSEEEIYQEAKRIVGEKKDFFSHLTAYVVVNATLISIWAFVTGRGYPWFAWPLGFWSLSILWHFMAVFVLRKRSTKNAIEKEAEKIRRNQK